VPVYFQHSQELIFRSHFGRSQPYRRCLCHGQRRHARPYLEVSHPVSLSYPQILHMLDIAWNTSRSFCKLFCDAGAFCISGELLRPTLIAVCRVRLGAADPPLAPTRDYRPAVG
jgi:hypothetical protein